MSFAVDDITQIKKSRAVAKGQITVAANILDKIHVQKDGKFDHKAFNEIEVKGYPHYLQKNCTSFKEAHSKVLILREMDANDQEEKKLMVKEEKYFNYVTD